MEDAFHPGAAKYGNFINYYEFNTPDARLELIHKYLPSNLLGSSPIVALDVGCNCGVMTNALYKSLAGIEETRNNEVHMLGIDLDSTLILRAKEKNVYLENITYSTSDVMQVDFRQSLILYLNKFDKSIFDIGFCLSITMWIHLNHGDDGLKTFLDHVSSTVHYLVIEPQPWKCYRTAVRRMRKLRQTEFPHYNALKHRGGVIDFIKEYLTKDCSMTFEASCGETGWGRPIWLFKNRAVVL